jgi:hypothetical protein
MSAGVLADFPRGTADKAQLATGRDVMRLISEKLSAEKCTAVVISDHPARRLSMEREDRKWLWSISAEVFRSPLYFADA